MPQLPTFWAGLGMSQINPKATWGPQPFYSTVAPRRTDILAQPEQVGWLIFVLELNKPLVFLGSIRGFDSLGWSSYPLGLYSDNDASKLNMVTCIFQEPDSSGL